MGINKDQVKGRAKEAAGKVQEVAGKAVGSETQRAKGMAKKVAGAAQATYGDVKENLTRAILDAVARDGFDKYQREWNYYPVQWREPFLGRRRKIGWDMYGLLGVGKGDHEGTHRARLRNYEFFGAPVGMIFTLDEDIEIGSWLDLGILLGAIMIAARGRGLDTCPQAAFADFHSIIRPQLGIPANEIVICGLALGHIDPDAPVNELRTERAAVAEFTTFHGI